MHREELTTAQLALIQAESNRNKETKPEPFKLQDFCFFADTTETPKPPSAAGAAMLALLEQDLFPYWAINGPWLEDLEREGKGVDPPHRLCWAAEDAILLAPWRHDSSHWSGMLIAMASAAGQVRHFYDEKGESIILEVPVNAVPKNAFSGGMADAMLEITYGKTSTESTILR